MYNKKKILALIVLLMCIFQINYKYLKSEMFSINYINYKESNNEIIATENAYYTNNTKQINTWYYDEAGNRYYFDKNGELYRDGIKEIDGKKYLFDSEGRAQKGFQKVGEHLYYFGLGSYTQQMNRWHDEAGNRYYFDKDGEVYRDGIKEIGGKKYLFDSEGRAQKGFQKVGEHLYYFGLGSYTQQMNRWHDEAGNRYYFDKDGEVYRDGIKEISGKKYLFDSEGRAQKGFQKVGEHLYYFGLGSYTQQMNRWHDEAGNRYYFDKDGEVYRDGIKEISGKKYLFDSEGRAQKGFQKVGEHLYYFGLGSYTQQMNRWHDEAGNRYYFDKDGEVYRDGIKEISGKKYLFDSEGRAQKGFQKVGEHLYYFGLGSYTQQMNRWHDEAGNRYYFDKDGEVYRDGIKEISGKKYLFDSEGRAQKGFQKVGEHLYYFGLGSYTQQMNRWHDEAGNRYYFDKDGEVYRDGIKEIGGKKYLFNSEGAVAKGIKLVDNKLYYFNSNTGYMHTNKWYIENGKYKYYFGDDGIAYNSGIKKIDGNEYYFETNGELFKGVKILNGKINCFGVITGIKQYNKWYTLDASSIYYVDSTGNAYSNGDYKIDNKWYKFDVDGKLKTGWQTINGKKYYLYADGSRATNISKIAGVRYEFSATGELQHENVRIIADISKYQGNIDWNKLWSSGEIDGVILRVGVTGNIDSYFERNLREVKKLNIPYSIYHFSLAENANEALFEANHFKNWYSKYNLTPSMEVFYDIESWYNNTDGHSSDGISKEVYDQIISTYITELNNAGIVARIYTGKNYALTRLSAASRAYVTWIAEYATDCTYPYSYRGWQYTSKARLPGITENTVDLSVFYY